MRKTGGKMLKWKQNDNLAWTENLYVQIKVNAKVANMNWKKKIRNQVVRKDVLIIQLLPTWWKIKLSRVFLLLNQEIVLKQNKIIHDMGLEPSHSTSGVLSKVKLYSLTASYFHLPKVILTLLLQEFSQVVVTWVLFYGCTL